MSFFSTKPSVDENPRQVAKPFGGVSALAGVRRPLGDVSNNGLSGAAGAPLPKPIAAARIPPITSASSLVAARTGGDPLTSTTDALASMRLSSAPAIAAPAPVETRDIMASFRDLSVDQVDAADLSDARRVGDYAQAIISYNKEREVVKCPRGTSMTAQTDINEKFRAILVDWLVEVHLKFKLSPETLYLAVSIMDRFLEKKIISRTTLQLVGITSILLASKYEEIYAPAVRDLVFVSARAYSREEILRMETTMLNTLKFNLTVPTAFIFLQRGLKVIDADAKMTNLAQYYVERSLQEYAMLRHVPSLVAASGIFLAMKTLQAPRRATWSSTLQHFSGYSEGCLRDCVSEMHGIMAGAVTSQLQAVRKKYTSSKYEEVAKLAIPAL